MGHSLTTWWKSKGGHEQSWWKALESSDVGSILKEIPQSESVGPLDFFYKSVQRTEPQGDIPRSCGNIHSIHPRARNSSSKSNQVSVESPWLRTTSN